MTTRNPRNLAASVRQRLMNHSLATQQDFQGVLARYAFERLLYRLGTSSHADDFTLKGALLFLVWTGESYRPTRDIDLMSKDILGINEIKSVFCGICTMIVESDGLFFEEDTVAVETIRDDNEYGGMRVTLMGRLEQARIPIQIDIGFADAITPGAVSMEFPVLLDFPAPRISMYPPETSIAEKFHTIVVRGMLNSRMKDYYDIWVMSREFDFEGSVLGAAIKATFRRRLTPVPCDEVPIGLSEEFSTDKANQAKWTAFVRRSALRVNEEDLGVIVTALRGFLLPPCQAASNEMPFLQTWLKGKTWRDQQGG